MPLTVGSVGEDRVSSGVEREFRLGDYSETIVNDIGLGRYFETARIGRGNVIQATGFTIVAANATALAATTQFVVGFANLINSGHAAVIQRVSIQTRSGTPGGPFYFTAATSSAAITTAPAGTVINTASYASSSAMKAYNNQALTGFVVSGNILQVPVGGPAAIAAGAGVYSTDWECAGQIIVPPGAVGGIIASAAGTTHIVDAALYFAEVEWPLI
jgi:hypothetical protein